MMFNLTLYKRGLKGSWKLLLIFAAVLSLYFTVIVSMFDPKMGSALSVLSNTMPQLMAIVGMGTASTTLIGFLSAYLYGFLMLIFPMVYSMLTANRLVAKLVDSGSMVYLLAAPVKRRSVAFTQMKVLLTGIFALIAFATVICIISCEIYFPGQLDIGMFILLNVGALCLHMFIGGICFLFSCLCGDSKYAIGLGAGIPALSFIMQMIANAGVENAKYASFFTLFDPEGITAGETGAIVGIVVLFIGAVILFASSIAIFQKKDLHI